MARITLKGSFENWEVIDNCTVVLDDYADTDTEKDFIGLKVDNTKKQIIVRLHKAELNQIIRATQAIQVQAKVSVKTADDGNKIRWFMELALKMRETGYSDASIYSIDTDAWDEYRVDDELTPSQAITEEESNG